MPDERFEIKVSMKGTAGVVADSRVVKGAVKGMSDQVHTASGAMRENAKASDELVRSHSQVTRSNQSVSNSLKDMNARFTGFRNIIGAIKWPALIAGAGYAAQGLGQLGAAAVGLASALGPLTGVLAAYPSLFAAFGQGAGVAALAFGGITGVLGEMEKAQGGAAASTASTGKAIKAASEGVLSAERSLSQSQTQARLAQTSLTQARHEAIAELKNLKNASMSAGLSEERAMISLREAKQALTKGERTGGTTGTELSSLELGVREAQQSLRESRLSAARAHGEAERATTRGVAKNPKVVEQTRGLHEARLAVTESNEGLAKAEESVTEAMNETGTAATNLATKMSALPAAAQTFAKFLYGLKPKLDTLRETAAKGLLPGVEKGITKALPLFPKLNAVTGKTATAMGSLATKAGELVGSKAFGKDIKSIGDNNVKVIEKLGGAGLHLGDALVHVMVAAEPLVKWMSGLADQWANYIDKAAKSGQETGKLAHFFEETKETLKTVGSIIGNVAKGFWDIGKAAKPLGDDILKSLNEQAESFSKWTDSLHGQNVLKTYFEEAKPGIYEMGRLVKAVGEDFFKLTKGTGFETMTRALRTELLPVFTEIVEMAAEGFGPALIETLTQIGTVIGDLSGAGGGLTLFVTEIGSMIKLLNGAFDHIPGLKGFVTTLAAVAITSKALKFTGMVTGLKDSLEISKKILTTLGFIQATDKKIAGEQLAGSVPGIAAGVGGTAARSAEQSVIYDAKGGILSTVEKDAPSVGGAAVGAGGATKGASIASKALRGAGLVGEDGAATAAGLATAGIGTVVIVSAHALMNPTKLSENPHHEKNLHLEGLELNVAGGKSEKQLNALRGSFSKTMAKLKADAILGTGAINKALETGLGQADEVWAHGSSKWRGHTAQAMKEAIAEIKQGMHAGTVDAEEGQQEINALLKRIHLVKGRDSIGIAEDVSKEFKEAGKVTSAGVSNFTRELQQMPKGAREQTRAATTAMLDAWAQGHPKLERQVASLTTYMTTKFQQSGRESAAAQRNAMKHIIEQTAGASGSVASALTSIGSNLTSALRALGAHDIPQFKIEGEKRGHNLTPTAGEFAGGGVVTVPGRGLHDSVPLAVNGALNAVVAPGEKLMVVNRHQEPKLNEAVRDKFGVSGMNQFFASTPKHYMAGGGFTGTGSLPHPIIAGGQVGEREGDQHGVDTVWKAANAVLAAHSGVAQVITNGNRMDALHQPYLWGGGHGSTASRNGPWDCSGGTSELYDGSGVKGSDFNFPPMVSGGFESWGKPGKGDLTVMANADHVYSVIKSHGIAKAIGTSEENPGGGFGWVGGYTYRPGFTVRHADIGDLVHGGGKSKKGQAPVKGFAGGGFVGDINHLWAEHEAPDYGGPTLPPYVIEALAEAAGMPGVTAYQITRGESGGRPGSSGTDAAPTEGRTTKGYGLFAITSGVGNESMVAKFGGFSQMLNPVKNVAAADEIWKSSGIGAWHGTGYVTNSDAHYTGNYDIRDALGGLSFKDALAGKPAPGATSTSGASSATEKVPSSYMGCQTEPLTIPADQPKTLKEVNAEIHQRSGEITRYSKAAASATRKRKPALAAALRANIGLLRARRTLLENLKVTMKQAAAQARFAKKTRRSTEKVTGLEEQIESAQGAYNSDSELAGQVVALEPVEEQGEPFRPPPRPSLKGLTGTALEQTKKGYETTLAGAEKAYEDKRRSDEQAFQRGLIGYVQNQEEPAYRKVLGDEAGWRNTILRAESKATGLEQNYEGRISKLVENESSAQGVINEANRQISKWREEHPNAKQLPEGLQKLADRRDQARANLKSENQQEAVLRKELGVVEGVFYPGGGSITQNPTPPAPGSGTFEENLIEVQGARWPGGRERLKSLPAARDAGSFGGAIWETQSVIEELGLKIKSAAAAIQESEVAGEGSGWTEAEELEAKAAEEAAATTNEIRERELELLKERNTVLEREAAIHTAQAPVLRGDYLGMKLAGGELPRDGYYFGHRGETVRTREESAAPAGVHVLEPHIHVSDELAPYISATIEKRFEKGGRSVGLGVSTPTTPGKRANMKGGR